MHCKYIFFFFAGFLVCVSTATTQIQLVSPQPLPDYFIEETDEGRMIIQRFQWQSIPGALQYDFTLEESTEDGWKEINFQTVTDNFVSIELSPGEYRYKIAVYNLLGIVETESEWEAVSIKQAYNPDLDSISPDIIYLEEANSGIFTVTGQNLREETKFYLRVINSQNTENIIFPLSKEIEENNRRVRLQFDIDQIDVADYVLVAENPGGLDAESSGIRIQFRKPIDFNISAGYMPAIIPYPDTVKTYFNSIFYPFSAGARITFIPVKRRGGYFGAAISGAYSLLFYDTGAYTLSGHLVESNLLFVYQFPIVKHFLTFDAHVGGGFVYFIDTKFSYSHDLQSDILNAMFPAVSGGLSLQFYVLRRLYIECGADVTFAFAPDMPLLITRPQLSIGWQF